MSDRVPDFFWNEKHRDYFAFIPGFKNEAISQSGKVIAINHRFRSMCDRVKKWRLGGYKRRYARVGLGPGKNGVDAYIHRLVLLAWVGSPPSEFHQAEHIDGNPLNNNISNLKWATPKENSLRKKEHGTSGAGELNAMAKISDADAEFIIKNYASMTVKSLREKYKIKSIVRIATGRYRHQAEFVEHYKKNKVKAQENIRNASFETNKLRSEVASIRKNNSIR